MLNVVTIMGRMTRDPELRKTGSGKSVASFSLAVERDRKNESGDRDVDFIDCVAWGQTGDFVAKYFQKGSMAVVSGRLQIRGWTDKDGNKRRAAEIVANSVYFGSSKNGEQKTTDGFAAPSDASSEFNPSEFPVLPDDDETLPF